MNLDQRDQRSQVNVDKNLHQGKAFSKISKNFTFFFN